MKKLLICVMALTILALYSKELTMDIIQHGIVADECNGKSPINPSGIAKLANGELMMVFSDSTDMVPPSKVYAVYSRDGGKTWSEPGEPIFANQDEKEAVGVSMFQLPDGKQLIAVFKMMHSKAPKDLTELLRAIHVRLWSNAELFITSDGGKTLEKVAKLAEDGQYTVISINGSILQLQNGDLLLPGYQGAPCKGKTGVQGSGFWRSKDGGKTWGAFEKVFTNEKNFNEATYIQKDDGTIVGFARWDKPYHPDKDNGDNQLSEMMYRVESKDNGETWSKPVPTNMLCIYPVSTRLANGTFIIFGGKRNNPGRDRTCHIWASIDGDRFVDLGPVYYYKPEHRNGKMDSLWGTTGGCSAILPLSEDTFIVGFNGGNVYELPPYQTYVDHNIIKISLKDQEKTVKSDNLLLNAGSWRVTGGKVETVMRDGEAVLKVSGPAVLESKRIYPADPDIDRYRIACQFRSENNDGINFFGARCFKDSKNVVNPINWTVDQTKTKLAESCRPEDTILKVKDASKWWRSSYFRLKIGTHITGRDLGIVRKKDGYYEVPLQNPCGVSYPAGTAVYLQANGNSDVFFGGIKRGTDKWRTVDRMSMVKNHSFSPNYLRPGTKFVRVLMKLNQDGDKNSVVYIKNLKFEKVTDK